MSGKAKIKRVLYGTTLFGKKKIKMSTASKIFSKLDHIAGVGNGGYRITKNPATPTAAFEIALIAVVLMD